MAAPMLKRRRPLVQSVESEESDDGPEALCMEANEDGEGNDEATDLEELEEFARTFKQKRIKIGFTQGDVGLAVGRVHGADFSQTTISRFEALNLSFRNMCKLKPLLEKWLEETEAAIANGTYVAPDLSQCGYGQSNDSDESMLRKRKKRTHLDQRQRSALVDYYRINPRPEINEMVELGDRLNLDREVIRVWFCNRRQKERKEEGAIPTHPCSNLGLMLFSADAYTGGRIPASAKVQVNSGEEVRLDANGTPIILPSAVDRGRNDVGS